MSFKSMLHRKDGHTISHHDFDKLPYHLQVEYTPTPLDATHVVEIIGDGQPDYLIKSQAEVQALAENKDADQHGGTKLHFSDMAQLENPVVNNPAQSEQNLQEAKADEKTDAQEQSVES